MSDEGTKGIFSYEDLPEEEQERQLKQYHKEVREGKFADQPTVEDAASVAGSVQARRPGARKARWEQQQERGQGLSLTQLALAEIYKDAIEKNLEKFKNKYNTMHPDNKISLALTLNNRIFDEPNGTGAVAQASVRVEIRENGVGRVLIAKVYNFTHKRQIMDEGEWKLTLYSEILYELIGAGITLGIVSNPENNIGYGNKEQSTTG